MRADASPADVIGAVVAIVSARRTVRFVIVQAVARPVAGIRIRAVIVRRITARRTNWLRLVNAAAGGIAGVHSAVIVIIAIGGHAGLATVGCVAGLQPVTRIAVVTEGVIGGEDTDVIVLIARVDGAIDRVRARLRTRNTADENIADLDTVAEKAVVT